MSTSGTETLDTHRQFTKKKPDWPKAHMKKECSALKSKTTVSYYFAPMGLKKRSVSGSAYIGTDTEQETLHTECGVHTVPATSDSNVTK